MKISNIKTYSTIFSSTKRIKKPQKPNTKQTYREIVFKPATTIDEAKNFARINFGIKEFHFEDDLEIANYVNEGLTNVKNRFQGKIYMPQRVGFGELDNLDNEHAFCDTKGEGFYIIKKAYDKKAIIEELKDVTKRAGFDSEIGIFKKVDGVNQKRLQEFGEIYKTMIQNPNDYSKIEWHNLLEQFEDVICELLCPFESKKEIPKRYLSPFDTIYHEMGHIQQIKNSTLFSKLFGKISTLNYHWHKFVDNPKNLETAKKVSWYAMSDQREFVAEVFVKLCNGRKIDDDVLKLYRYYNGLI